MTDVYTEDTLKALKKTQLVDVSKNARSDKFQYSLFDGRHGRSHVEIVQIENNNFLKQLENSERQCWANAQYF